MNRRTTLLIVGAGPYGLATAAYAQTRGVDHVLLGQPMEFWWRHMPDDMLLRSGPEWHIDPLDVHTFESYIATVHAGHNSASPIPVGLFRDYGDWFRRMYQLHAEPGWVRMLHPVDDGFEAQLASGDRIHARHVLLAPGFASFAQIPDALARKLPLGRFSHTCDTVRFEQFRDRRCLIVGGRQSAYEWAALAAQHGAATVHIVHRHAAPELAASDWSWVADLVRHSIQQPGWFAHLSSAEKERIRRRFWAEGRLKLEPWLRDRLDQDKVRVWPSTGLRDCVVRAGGELAVTLQEGPTVDVDHVIFATGYRVDLARIPCIAESSFWSRLVVEDGFPLLDDDFQSSMPGLYFTGLTATRDFGPFFGFVPGCRVAPQRIVERVRRA